MGTGKAWRLSDFWIEVWVKLGRRFPEGMQEDFRVFLQIAARVRGEVARYVGV